MSLKLKSLKSNSNKSRLKDEIRKIIAYIADDDMYANFQCFSSSTPVPSSGNFQLAKDLNTTSDINRLYPYI